MAAASQQWLDREAVCSLLTDRANPTAGRIYEALGYRPIADITSYRFAAG